MLSMGLSLTVSQILQPLRSTQLVIMALAANFVIVPAAAFALTRIIPLEEDVQIGLLLLGTAAGAPSLPKLAQIAKANLAFAVGLMTMLMLVTIVYLPVVLPLLLPGVEVSAGPIALSLIVTMLVPLLIGLVVLVGHLLGGPEADTKRVLALGTGQRNLSAAFIIATGSFTDRPNVLV